MIVEKIEQEKYFKPIVLNITIESPQDLCDLWHRMNVSNIVVNRESDELIKDCNNNDNFWKLLDTLVRENNLLK